MSRIQKWIAVGCIVFGAMLGIAQQQFSGGQAVTISGAIPTGANTIGGVNQSGTWTVQPGNTANTTAWKVDGSAVTQPVSMAAGLVAGTNAIGIVYPLTGCGATKFESGSPAGFVALAASTVTVTATTTCVLTLVVTNTGASSFTYYVTDGAATPVPVIGSSGNPITILPGERDEYTFQNGSKFNAGVKLTSSATSGTFYIFGLQ